MESINFAFENHCPWARHSDASSREAETAWMVQQTPLSTLFPTHPWWQRCCFVWGLLCLIWLWEWLLELLVGFLLLSSETSQWNWRQLLKILTTIWLVSFLPQSWNVRAEWLKMSLSIITVNSKIPDYILKCQT